MQYAVAAVCSGCSTQWIQWNSDIWWWGHCSLVQKGQTSGHSVQWTQWNSDMVVGTLFFGAKRSNQWMQYAVDAVG